MKAVFKNRRSGLGVACKSLALAAAVLSMGTSAQATSYDEASQGDLSNTASAPTPIGSLTLGNNTISGATIPTGDLNPVTHSRPNVDNDYVSFTVPTGDVLSALVIDTSTSIQPGDQLFFGIAQGSTVNVDPSFTSANGLLGWTLVGASMVGTNVLPNLGSPPIFPDPAHAITGATGFTGSLGAGTYTLWLLDGDSPVTYKLDLAVSQAPEPASWAMMLAGFGFIGSTLRRRVRKTLVVSR